MTPQLSRASSIGPESPPDHPRTIMSAAHSVETAKSPRLDSVSRNTAIQLSGTQRKWVRAHVQGFADARGSGTRWGPVHLFSGGTANRPLPLCGRQVKQWNFEGETIEDFCPKCLRLALAALETELRRPLTAKQRTFLRGLPADGTASACGRPNTDVWFPLDLRGLITVVDVALGRPRFALSRRPPVEKNADGATISGDHDW